MPRQPAEIDDVSPLTAEVDIGARIGWLLRTSRVSAGISLRDFGALVDEGQHFSAATLSRVETNGRRSGRVIAAYEQALGLRYGHLRAPVDVLCRTFAHAPTDAEPFAPPATLDDFSQTVQAVVGDPDAHDWLRFAEYHTRSSFGLPTETIRPLVERLASEVGRATGTAYQLRYEALSKLRCSAYRDVVEDVVRRAVALPGAQRPSDLVSAVTELPTPELVSWCGDLLTHESWLVARAGCLGLQNMRSVGGLGPEDWRSLPPQFVAACVAAAGDPLREPILSATMACLPPEVRAAIRSGLGRNLPAPRRAAAWVRNRRNTQFSYTTGLAARVSGSGSGEAMLSRLLFELLFDFRATHVVTTSFLLAASPFAAPVRELLCSTALEGPDEVTRHGAAYAFANLMVPFEPSDAQPWLASPDPVIRSAGLTISGFAGQPLAPAVLRQLALAGGELGRDALFAAGMSGQPELGTLAGDPLVPADVRDAATWWLREGGRILT